MKQIVILFINFSLVDLSFQRFVPSGCQFWYNDIISASVENFAYCSAIGIYIHNFANNFQCSKLFALKTAENSLVRLSFLSFHPQNPNLLVCLSNDNALNLWDIEKEKIILNQNFNGRVHCLDWSPFETDVILLVVEGYF